MRIAILETGEPPAQLKSEWPGYGAMMERMLGPLSPRFSFTPYRIFEGAPPPDPGAADGYLITGSAAGAYDGHAWIAPLEELIRRAGALGRPQVGICFGHQIMAQAFGGTVEKSDKGWGVGVHAYDVAARAAWMAPPSGRIACVVSHQDQVTRPPAMARSVAGSDFCPHGVLVYDHAPAMSMQPHPEFEHNYAAALYGARRGRLGNETANDALSSLKTRTDRAILAQWIAAFFTAHGA